MNECVFTRPRVEPNRTRDADRKSKPGGWCDVDADRLGGTNERTNEPTNAPVVKHGKRE